MTLKDIEVLIGKAETTMQRAIAPYSKFSVGAALMTEGGKIYTGSNIENPSLMLSLCAEKVALIKGLMDAPDPFKAMAIVSGEGRYCFPCGGCRQLLYEFAPDISIYLKSKQGIKKFTLEELLPYPFEPGEGRFYL